MPWIKSGKLFLRGLIKRFYIWAGALFLDPAGILQAGWPVYAEYTVVSTPWAWIILIGLLFWCAFLTYHEVRVQATAGVFKADLSPKDLVRYLRFQAEFGRDFRDPDAWFMAMSRVVRDELGRGNIRAEGRQPSIGSGNVSRYPPEIIKRDFWWKGDVNWTLVWNADYVGPVDAFGVNSCRYLEISFCREEVEAVWPRRSIMSRVVDPVPFAPFAKPPKGQSPPWRQDHDEPEASS